MPGNDAVHGPRLHRRRWAMALVVLVVTAASAASATRAADDLVVPPGDVATALRALIGDLHGRERPELDGLTLGGLGVAGNFYASRDFAPAWDASRAAELLGLLAAAPEHGLDPADFHLEALQRLQAQAPSGAEAAAARDLLLTEALIRYGYQRRFGKVNPRRLEPAWNFERGFGGGNTPETLLAEAMQAPSLEAFLAERLTGGPWYAQLRQGLARYRRMADAGGWAALPDGPRLAPGDRDARVAALRERLRAEALWPASGEGAMPVDAEFYDPALAVAVRTFQARHALDADGIVGARTRAALNVPAADRVAQLRLSLERVRWLRGNTPERYVVVNVASFRAGFVRDRGIAWTSRVVVGRAARQTPIFRGLMTYVEINPTWTVPPTILREDVLPKVRRDPRYLLRENISVLDGSGRRMDPLAIDWSTVPPGRYVLRQEPGPDNALGRIKLMFPNRHAVYLHDTPAKELFSRPDRTFSSGCIRVEDPLGLAEQVLDSPEWSRASLEQAIAAGKTRRINLPQPVPVLLVYLTAVAEPEGIVFFYRDVYDRDPALRRALEGPVRIDLPAPG